MMMQIRLNAADVTDALERLRKANAPAFGVGSHNFLLNERLREMDVLSFEKQHNVHLPGDYREFVTEIGNGGAGPYYGIFPLGQMDSATGVALQAWSEQNGFVGVLSKPFPHDTAWNDTSDMPTDDLRERAPAEYESQLDEFESKYWSSSLVNGAIPICHEGCALRIWLVLTGRQAGHLWEDRRSEYGGIVPVLLRDGTPATFSGWYREWLEGCRYSAKPQKS